MLMAGNAPQGLQSALAGELSSQGRALQEQFPGKPTGVMSQKQAQSLSSA